MTQNPPQLTDAERLCAIRVYVLAAWGIIGLLATGEVSIIATLLALGLMPLAWRRHLRDRPVRHWFWNILTVAAMVAAVSQYRVSSLDSVVHFFIFLQVAKIFTYRTPSDASWIVLVSLFHLVATAVFTAGLIFVPLFGIHLVLTAAVLGALSVVRGELAAGRGPTFVAPQRATAVTFESLQPWTVQQPNGAAARFLGFNRWLGVLCLVILGFTLAIFPVIPRLSTQRLFDNFSPQGPSGAVSDFGEDIQFGQYGEIGLSNEVALYAQPRDPARRGDHVRLRGVAVDTFDGSRWRRSTQHSILMGPISYSDVLKGMGGETSDWTIRIQPGRISHLFSPSHPKYLRLDNNQSVLFDQLSASAQLPGAPTKLFTYSVQAHVDSVGGRRDPGTTVEDMLFEQRPARTISSRSNRSDSESPTLLERLRERAEANSELFRTNGTAGTSTESTGSIGRVDSSLRRFERVSRQPVSDRGYVLLCMEVPELLNTTELLRLAQEWTRGTNENPYRMALAIESRLRTTYQYSLQQTSRGNFIEDFLLRTRSGHCEYFATSMAMLLRLVGVPTRVVNGYYSNEWDEANKTYIVRQKDAHAWVEVYLGDGVGWMTFDPTPPSGVNRTVSENRLARWWRETMETIRLKWYRNVIDFSIQDQQVVRQVIFSPDGLVGRISRMLRQSSGSSWQEGWLNAVPATTVGFTLVLIGLGLLAVVFRDRIWLILARARFDSDRRRATVRFYDEILKQLARRGFVRPDSQTPREFASDIAGHHQDLRDLSSITETYYAVRFLEAQPTDQDRERALNFVQFLKKWKPQKGK